MNWEDILKRDGWHLLLDLSSEFDDVVAILKDMSSNEIGKTRQMVNPDHIREVQKALQEILKMELFMEDEEWVGLVF